MSALLDLLAWVFWTLWSIVSWVLWQLVWIFVWFLLPFALAAFIALRIAEKALGPDVVRAWVKAKTMRFGAGAWDRTRRLLFALGVLPLRVLGWLMVYALWHSIVSLFWRPRWSPWQRAWAKRWKAKPAAAAT